MYAYFGKVSILEILLLPLFETEEKKFPFSNQCHWRDNQKQFTHQLMRGNMKMPGCICWIEYGSAVCQIS